MDVGPAGLVNASVTKAIILATGGSSLLFQSQATGIKHHAAAIAETFIYRNLGELAIGTYLFYSLRIVERQRGSESFGAQAILVLGSQQIVHWILVATTDWALHLGPYALLASSFVSFFSDIPALQHYKVLGLTVSDKAVMYAAGAQLLLSAGRHSFPSFIVGALVGLAFQNNFLGIKRLKVPSSVSGFLGRTIGAALGGARSNQRIIVANGGSREHPASDGSRENQQAAVQVAPEALEQLLSMGFEEHPARTALQQSRNDVQAALTRLL